jgi:hypothetical protein
VDAQRTCRTGNCDAHSDLYRDPASADSASHSVPHSAGPDRYCYCDRYCYRDAGPNRYRDRNAGPNRYPDRDAAPR